MRNPLRAFFHIAAAVFPAMGLIPSAHAVIVSGTSGTGNNNAGEVSLQSYLSGASLPGFSRWDNLVEVSDSSGVYLGYNPTSMNGWVLSANHIGTPSTITVDGTLYNVVGGTQIGGTDLKLYEIGGAVPPNLPTVPLASTAAVAGEFVLMAGRGYTTTSSATGPYAWGSTGPGTSMRWGTNRAEGTYNVGGNEYIITYFDEASDPSITAFEAQGASGDSGGGLFAYRGGQWVLAGIAHFVDDLDEEPINPSEYGDVTGYTDINSYLSTINGITGTLVPEPTAMMLLPLAGMGFLTRRRKCGAGIPPAA